MRLATIMFPQPGLKSAICKAAIEQISYTPFAMSSFYFGMSLLEGRSAAESFEEVTTKVPPTYKVAVAVWPVVAFVNFGFVPERNRVVFISCCSCIWTTFLAFVKQMERQNVKGGIIPLNFKM